MSNSLYLSDKLNSKINYNNTKNTFQNETLGSLLTDKQLLFYAIIYRYFIK